MSEWYLVQFKPNSHNLAARNLARQGLEVFLPLELATSRRASKFKNTLKPLFPGYMFVYVDPLQGDWRVINSTYGVSRLVRFAGSPCVVPKSLVHNLKARCEKHGWFQADTQFEEGNAVDISVGPFANFTAKIEKLEPGRRVWVLLDLMGQETRLRLPRDQIASAK